MYRITLPAIRQAYFSVTSNGLTKAPTFKGGQDDSKNQTESGPSDQFQRKNSAPEDITARMAALKEKYIAQRYGVPQKSDRYLRYNLAEKTISKGETHEYIPQASQCSF